MPVYSASSFATGKAYTATTPSSLVTATATATATSTLSQQDAQNIADVTAQNQANSAAQNDANIITQTLNLSTASLKGQYASLSLLEGIPSECNNGYLPNPVPLGYVDNPYLAGITGVIVNPDTTQKSLVVTVKKPIYQINSLDTNQSYPTTPITPGAYLTASYALTYQNFYANSSPLTNTPKYDGTDAESIFGPFTSLPITTQNVLSINGGSYLQGQRTSYKYTPNLNDVDYNIVVVSNVAILCSSQISELFTKDDINKGGFLQMNILNKMAQSISTYQPSTQTYAKFDGINMSQTVSSPNVGTKNWNYISSDFTNATLGGSSTSIAYPISLNTTLNTSDNDIIDDDMDDLSLTSMILDDDDDGDE